MSIPPSPVDPASSQPHRRRWLWLLAAVPLAVALTAAGFWWHARSASARIRAIAVLPFADMTHSSEQGWFGDGITDEVTDGLARIPSLRVAAQASAFQFKNQTRDLYRIGEQLGVAAVLEGSIQKKDGRFRVVLQLIRTADGYQLWSNTIEPADSEASSLPPAIIRAVAARIRILMEPAAPSRQPTAEAYDAYLQGRALFGQLDSASMSKAAESFAAATRLDSGFALAWAWQSIANEYRVDEGLVRPNEAMPEARDAAERAVALDAGSDAAHLAMGIVNLQYDWDWNGAKQEFDHALQLSPGSAFAQQWLAHWYETQGRLNDAMKQMQSALTLDPLSAEMLRDMVTEQLASGNPASALPFAQKAAAFYPNDPREKSTLIRALFYAGEKEQSQNLAASAGDPLQSALWSAMNGELKEARELLDQGDIVHTEQQVPAYVLVDLAAAAEDGDRLFYWLNVAYDERSVHLPYARMNPRIPAAEPRFVELLDKMNLPH